MLQAGLHAEPARLCVAELSTAAAHAQPALLRARTPALSRPHMRLLSLQTPLARGCSRPPRCARRPQRCASCDRKHHGLAALPVACRASGGPLRRPRGAPLGAGRDRRGRRRLCVCLQVPKFAAPGLGGLLAAAQLPQARLRGAVPLRGQPRPVKPCTLKQASLVRRRR